MRFLPLSFLLGLLPATLFAQQAAPASTPAGPKNLITNGGFERFSSLDNLWDGVDSNGNLAGIRGETVKAIGERGLTEMTTPLSVAAADLNGDGLIDIVTADSKGWLRAYFNSGTKEEAKFTNAEIIPIYLSRQDVRKNIHINLFDWARRGVEDLTIGNYYGELFFLPNTGSAQKPDFRQPADLVKACTPTNKGNVLWANLLAPAAWDFNKDNLTDLIVGEGSYSANSVHLLLNKGSNARPVFNEENRFYLAYGDGKEHLTPAVVDYNGDGFPDVLASNRTGSVGVYLNPGASWKPGQEFKWKEDVSFGSLKSLGTLTSVCAADMNGDGLFDLLIGKTDGRVLLAINRGTKTEPKFDPPAPVKGVDLWGRINHPPSGWTFDVGVDRGNAYINISCVSATEDPKAAPPEGKACLWVGYLPSPNKFFSVPHLLLPSTKLDGTVYEPGAPDFWREVEYNAARQPTNTIIIRKTLPKLKQNATYALSFKTKGNNVANGTWTIAWSGYKKLAEEKVERQERGDKVTKFEVWEEGKTTGALTGGNSWSEVSKTFRVEKFKNKDLQDVPDASAVLEFRATLAPNAGNLYFDDLQLFEK